MIDHSNGHGSSYAVSKERSQLKQTIKVLVIIGALWVLALGVIYFSFQHSKSIKDSGPATVLTQSK
ncbi:hypothetical protein [Pedobacter panaciterrae]